ncbi:MAG: group II intron reverse transcriptase domain-containing protein [Prevotella sp.]|nr:group II intron reverse transcriptase domain-containing protein [Prevotella sp.]
MESIITQTNRQETWEDFLAYRLMRSRFTWHEFKEADSYVEQEKYLHLAQKIAQGESLGLPTKKIVNKMGTGKKRVVYSFESDEMIMLKLIAYKLYDYDECFAPNCFAFRRGVKAHDAVFHIRRAIGERKMWAYKLDIHDYFNSISIELLLPMLAEMMVEDPPLYHFLEKMLTDNRVVYNGEIILENHGVMAGTPTAPFLANVYLKEVDKYFYDANVVYARYSDDIIMFAPDIETLREYKRKMAEFLKQYRLELNPDKEKTYSPDEAYEFLGFKCHANDIDISAATRKKMKGKIKRATKSLYRWSSKKNVAPEKAMKGLVNHFNHLFYENGDTEALTWSRWFFPIINKTEGLKEIDHYLQQNIRFLSTGKHNKANYKTNYAQLKLLGYKSLVNEYYKYRKHKKSKITNL